jgi:hypothetical protein
MDNARKWAQRLDGREYREEMTRDEDQEAADDGVLIVFGASDDLTEFRGAGLNEEWGLGEIPLRRAGKTLAIIEHPPNRGSLIRNGWTPPPVALTVHSFFDDKGFWATADVPHETFRVMEDGEVYGYGIVIDVSAILAPREEAGG